jgi:hypothetical protein
MLEFILPLTRLSVSTLLLGGLVVFFLSRRLYVDYKIRKLGGVRAGVLATNPITGQGVLAVSRPWREHCG